MKSKFLPDSDAVTIITKNDVPMIVAINKLELEMKPLWQLMASSFFF